MPTSIWLDTIKWNIVVFAANAGVLLVVYLLFTYLTAPTLIPHWLRQLLSRQGRRRP